MEQPGFENQESAGDSLLRGRGQPWAGRNADYYHDDGSGVYSSGLQSVHTAGIPLLPMASHTADGRLSGQRQVDGHAEDLAGPERPAYSTRPSSASLPSKAPAHINEYGLGAGSPSPDSKTVLQRIGWAAFGTLLVALLLKLTAACFLLFLWYSGPENHIWQTIMVRQWLTRAVSITALVVRTGTEFEAGIAVAMLASLLLEAGLVKLKDAPLVSTTRAAKSSPGKLLYPFFDTAGSRSYVAPLAVLLLCATTYSLQFSSTVLLSDIRLGQLPSLTSQNSTTCDFVYSKSGSEYDIDNYGWFYPFEQRASTWLRPPPAFPAFAEYKEPMTTPEGVDDTGTLLRAFLPFPDAQSREQIRNYTGKTVVLDSRVSCQPPKLSDVYFGGIGYSPDGKVYTGAGRPAALSFEGHFAPSRNVTGLWAPPLNQSHFNCSFFPIVGVPSICQPAGHIYTGPTGLVGNTAGGLVSMFSNVSDPAKIPGLVNVAESEHAFFSPIPYGSPFLIFTLTNTTESGWDMDRWLNSWQPHNFSLGPGTQYREHGPWLDINATQPASCQNQTSNSSTCLPDDTAALRVTVCYTAWDAARLNVDVHSDEQRSEPIVGWTPENGLYTEPDLGAQLGLYGANISTHVSRGVMTLTERTSWLPEADDYPGIVPLSLKLASVSRGERMGRSLLMDASPDWTFIVTDDELAKTLDQTGRYDLQTYYDAGLAFLIPILQTDNTMGALFNQFLNRTNSPAQALASMITIISSMTYYDQMPRYQYMTNSTQVYFITVLFPQSHIGLWAVLVVMAAHTFLVCAVLIVFAIQSKFTLIGNYWQAVTQLYSGDSERLFEGTTMRTDKEIKKRLKLAGGGDAIVGVGPDGGGSEGRVALLRKDV